MPKPDGGCAFPLSPHTSDVRPGMSLRDYFAAAALKRYTIEACVERDITYEDMANRCYDIADEMLKAREA